jgi:putative protease
LWIFYDFDQFGPFPRRRSLVLRTQDAGSCRQKAADESERRVRNNEFNKEAVLAQGIAEAHALGKRFFLASNLAPHNNKVKTYLADLEPIVALGPDALIMSDPGLIMLVRERRPDLAIHLSVQSNVVNYAAVKFWQGIGLKRIILSRELSLKEVAEIRP